MDTQTIEILGRNRLVTELLIAGLEVALPLRDRGVDLIAYVDLAAVASSFVAVPIQMKAASTRAFSVDAKYAKISNLVIAYIWGLRAPEHAQTYALTHSEALGIAHAMKWTATASWAKCGYTTSAPSERLCALLAPFIMSPEAWREKVFDVSRVALYQGVRRRSEDGQVHVLSVDLASNNPRDLGIAILSAGKEICVAFVPPEGLGLAKPLQPAGLADALVGLAEASDCRWIAIDGPSGWKHPDNGLVHSRVSDRELNAPAKVGLPDHVKPRSYKAFIEFSIALFDALSDRGYSRLANTATSASEKTSVEILPVACWPRLQLPRLPAKAKCTPQSLAVCTKAISTLVAFQSAPSHDELQATIGGIAVLWKLLGRTDLVHLAGHAPVFLDGHWREGFILAPSKNLER
jgi:hypothetical protein